VPSGKIGSFPPKPSSGAENEGRCGIALVSISRGGRLFTTGTKSSNPSSSSRESANHRFLSYSRGAVKSAAVSEGEIAVASKEQLHSAPLSGKGLLALWNARPGIEKRKEVGDRDALIDQWAAIEASPEPEPQADAKRPPKQEKVIEMLRRPEGATVDEVVRATGWQRHTVRGVFLVRQFEEILNIGPQFASKVASASFADSMLASSGAITTTATSTGSPLSISPSLTNTFGPSSSMTCTSANSTTAALIFPVSVIIPSLHHLRRPRRAPRSRSAPRQANGTTAAFPPCAAPRASRDLLFPHTSKFLCQKQPNRS
jgi:hypothetical protein